MSWSWRTKPRSIVRTLQWFKEFGKLQGKNWDEEDQTKRSRFDDKYVHPIRRSYIYNAHSDEDTNISTLSYNQYISGKFDSKETESNGRNDKTTYEFFGFGYVDQNGLIHTTKVGQKIIDNTFDGEDFLKQLLKLQFPNAQFGTPKTFEKDDNIFPLEIIINAISELEYLNRSELVLTFGCQKKEMIPNVIEGIKNFRKKYNLLINKNDTGKVKALCEEIYIETYGRLENKIGSFYDYAEALCRCLIYTGIFQVSGRSIATKLRIPEYSKVKFKMLKENYKFERKTFENIENYMAWYGDTDSIALPWENVEARREIVDEKIKYINELQTQDDFIKQYSNDNIAETIKEKIDNISNKLKDKNISYGSLKDVEQNLTEFITNIKEKEYIDHISQTKEARQEILDKYDEILDAIDMSALWLEVNTWKSLLAMRGNKKVIRNFQIEEDLTPKSFAPGIGNTPDMELYSNEYIIIPEVSLMTGVQQWEHEASSVIDHVLSFVKEYKDKKVRGVFISSSINIRTKWQFFILNKESWVSQPVPVIPMTINQYKSIINSFYKYDLDVEVLGKLLDDIHEIALNSKTYDEWFTNSNICLENFNKSYALVQ